MTKDEMDYFKEEIFHVIDGLFTLKKAFRIVCRV